MQISACRIQLDVSQGRGQVGETVDALRSGDIVFRMANPEVAQKGRYFPNGQFRQMTTLHRVPRVVGLGHSPLSSY